MTALIRIGDNYQPELIEEFAGMKEDALSSSALITVVKTVEKQTEAVEAACKIKTLLKQVEVSRIAIKNPFLDACQRIDAAAKEAVKELKEEELRLATAVGTFQQEQLEIARQKERERQEELQRIENLRLAEERRIREEAEQKERERQAEIRRVEEERLAEQRKIEAEANAARTKKAKAEAEAKRLELEAKRKADAEKAEQERVLAGCRAKDEKLLADNRAAQAIEAVGPQATTAKAQGQVVTPKWTFAVVDIWLLARMHPGFVKIEVNSSEIHQALKMGVREIKGLRVFEEVKSTVRVSAQRPIDV